MFHRVLKPYDQVAYALLRIMSGLMFSVHGMQKLFGILTDRPRPEIGTQMWFGGVIEFTCGLLIAAGLFSPWAAILASGEMAVAYLQFHWKLRLDAAFFPTGNGGELALLYSCLFLFIACYGPGRASLAHAFTRHGRSPHHDRSAHPGLGEHAPRSGILPKDSS